MRRFRFNLEALLQLKTHQLEVLEAEIANLERQQQRRRQSLVLLEKGLADTGETRLASMLLGLDAQSLHLYYERWVCLFEQIHQQCRDIEQAREFLEGKRAEHLDLFREHRMLEEMKSRAKRNWWAGVLKEEQKILDEFGTLRFTREARER